MPSAMTPVDLEDMRLSDRRRPQGMGTEALNLEEESEVIRRRGAEQNGGCQGLGEGREGFAKNGYKISVVQ